MHTRGNLDEFDPAKAVSLSDIDILYGLYDALLTPEETGFAPSIAESWKVEKGYAEFILRDGLKFSDGSPISAESVALSLRRTVRVSTDARLKNCLKASGMNPEANILFKGSRQVLIKNISNCRDLLLEILVEIGHAIVKVKDPQSLKMDRKVTSGVFKYGKNEGDLRLDPNPHHPGWARTKESKRCSVSLRKTVSPEMDFFRTSELELINKFTKKYGYQVTYSLPIMVWYLHPRRVPEAKATQIYDTMFHIRSNLKRESIVSMNSELTHPSSRFFPKGFGCDQVSESHYSGKKIYNKIRVLPPEFGFNQSVLFDVRRSLELLGYKISERLDEDTLELQLNGQFLSSNPQTIISFATWARPDGIPDPRGVLKEAIKKETKHLCEVFHRGYHIPLGFNTYAFLTRKQKYNFVFSRTEGTVLLHRLVGVFK